MQHVKVQYVRIGFLLISHCKQTGGSISLLPDYKKKAKIHNY